MVAQKTQSVRKFVLRKFAKFTGKTCARMTGYFIKKETLAQISDF